MNSFFFFSSELIKLKLNRILIVSIIIIIIIIIIILVASSINYSSLVLHCNELVWSFLFIIKTVWSQQSEKSHLKSGTIVIFIYLFGYLLSSDPYSKDDKCLWDPKKVSGKECKSFDKNTASRLDL